MLIEYKQYVLRQQRAPGENSPFSRTTSSLEQFLGATEKLQVLDPWLHCTLSEKSTKRIRVIFL